MAASLTDVYNLALTYLGAQTVQSPTENSRNARALSGVYDITRQSELRKKPSWNFSIKMAQLPASSTTPLFDRAYSYPLPSDFLAMHEPYPESNNNDRDWVIQNGQIYTNDNAINLRYVSDVTDVSKMDPLFQKSLAAQLAVTTCDTITQSNSKLQANQTRYEDAIQEARKANSFDNVAKKMPEDPWITVRY